MASMRERVYDAFRNLGVEVGYQDANKWIKKKYGDGVSDATFYNSRKEFRANQLRTGGVSTREVVQPAPTPAPAAAATNSNGPTSTTVHVEDSSGRLQREITLAELQQVKEFAVRMGGRQRLTAILDVLEQLVS